MIDLEHTTAQEIGALHEAGVRSIRLNLEVKGEHSVERSRATLRKAFQLLAATRWSIQLYADLSLIEGLAGEIRAANTDLLGNFETVIPRRRRVAGYGGVVA